MGLPKGLATLSQLPKLKWDKLVVTKRMVGSVKITSLVRVASPFRTSDSSPAFNLPKSSIQTALSRWKGRCWFLLANMTWENFCIWVRRGWCVVVPFWWSVDNRVLYSHLVMGSLTELIITRLFSSTPTKQSIGTKVC